MDNSGYRSKVEDIVHKGYVSIAIAMGNSLGIFDIFKSRGNRCTAIKLASTAGLKERLLMEWLGCMVAADLMYVTDQSEYVIPDVRPLQAAQTHSQMMIMLAKQYEVMTQSMHIQKSTGPDFEFLAKMNEYVAQERKRPDSPWYIDTQFVDQNITPVLELIGTRHGRIKLLDFGCGSGRLSFAISDRFPEISVTGVDIDEGVLLEPKRIVRENSTGNLTFLTQTSEHLSDSLSEPFDIIVMNDVLHDLPNPASILQQLKRCLKPEGYLVTFDPSIHSNHRDNAGDMSVASRYLTSLFVCLPRSLSQKPAAGLGMGWGYKNKIKFLEEQGFSIINIDEDEKYDTPKERIVAQINL